MIASKCGWTPFNNHKVKGFPVATIDDPAILDEIKADLIDNKILKL